MKERNRTERILNHLEGRAWIAADYNLMRAYARLMEPVKYGFGILANVQDVDLKYQQTRFDGIWVPEIFALEYKARVVIKNQIKQVHSRYFDLTKRPAETIGSNQITLLMKISWKEVSGYLLIVVASCFWGGSASLGKSLFQAGMSTGQLMQVRSVMSAVVLSVTLALFRKKAFQNSNARPLGFVTSGHPWIGCGQCFLLSSGQNDAGRNRSVHSILRSSSHFPLRLDHQAGTKFSCQTRSFMFEYLRYVFDGANSEPGI